MIYVQVEHQLYKGRTFKSLVKSMYETSFDAAITKKHWMFDVKKRIKDLYDQYVDAEDYEGFIRSLDSIGLIRLFKCEDCDHYNANPRRCFVGVDMVNPQMCECSQMDNKEIRRIKSAS